MHLRRVAEFGDAACSLLGRMDVLDILPLVGHPAAQLGALDLRGVLELTDEGGHDRGTATGQTSDEHKTVIVNGRGHRKSYHRHLLAVGGKAAERGAQSEAGPR